MMQTVKKYFALLIVIPLWVGCSSAWSEGERVLINEADYSRMRVVTIANEADSLLLRTPSKPLTQRHIEAPEFGRLVASMVETVGDPENEGVGIAAPQVGVLRRVVVVQRFDKEGTPFEVYVNPEIVARGERVVLGPEGCLSVPDRREDVSRATEITLRYRDAVTFELREERVEGFTAVIFQHEIDHLDGILYIDR
jgi:peptide deformylase